MVGNFVPPVNSSLIFLSYGHRFYDDFPVGKQIRARDAGVNFYLPIEVLDVRGGSCARIDKLGVASETLYVAVKFETASGASLWTNFSRDDIAMMHFS